MTPAPDAASGSRLLQSARLLLFTTIAIMAWRAPGTAGFWLDETLTAWITSGSFSESTHRSLKFQGQSPLYFQMLWLWRQVAGESELALRLPSLLAFLLSTGLIYHLGKLLLGPASAGYAVIIFIGLDGALVAALSARPYALALSAALLSFWAWLHWLRTPRLGFLLLNWGSFLFTFYLHYLFILLLVPQVIYTVAVLLPRQSQLLRPYAAAAFFSALAAAPGFYHLFQLKQGATRLFFAAAPKLGDLAAAICPPPLALYLLGGALGFALFFNLSFNLKLLPQRNLLALLLLWALSGPLLLFSYSLISGNPLLLERYFLWQLPALALLGAAMMAAIVPLRARRAALLGFVCFFLARESLRIWHIEDWKGAATYSSAHHEGVPVLLYSGLIEADTESFLRNADKQAYLSAALNYYQPSLLVKPLPADPEMAPLYLEKLRADITSSAPQVLLISLKDKTARGVEPLPAGEKYRRLLESWGYFHRAQLDFGLVDWQLLERDQAGHNLP